MTHAADQPVVIWLFAPDDGQPMADGLRRALEPEALCLLLGPAEATGADLRLGPQPDLAQALAACPAHLRPKAVVCLGPLPPAGLEQMPCPRLAWGPVVGCDQRLPEPPEAAAAAILAAVGLGPALPWLDHVQVNMPLRLLLAGHRALVQGLPVNLELGLDAQGMDELTPDDLAQAQALAAGRRLTAHLPFMDLHPAAADPLVAAAAVGRLEQAARLAVEFGAEQAVAHLGFWAPLHRDLADFARRFAQAMAPVARTLAAGGCRLALENTMEPWPAPLLACRQALAEAAGLEVGFCLDVGHALTFSRTDLPRWWRAMDGRLWEMHLHDNDGSDDFHHPPGSGLVDWGFIAAGLRDLERPPILTLEPHSEPHFWASLRGLEKVWGRPEACLAGALGRP